MHRSREFLNPSVKEFSDIHIKVEFLLIRLVLQLGDFKATGMKESRSEYATLSHFLAGRDKALLRNESEKYVCCLPYAAMSMMTIREVNIFL